MKKKLEKVFNFFGYIYIKIFDIIASLFTSNHASKMLSLVCRVTSANGMNAVYSLTPTDTTVIPVLNGLSKSRSLAIIMQGPICKTDDMTLKTICFYKKIYPYAIIIISTWEDEPKEYIIELEKQGVILVKNKKPKVFGIMNLNLQLVSSLAGINKARELGCEFAIKTRTDQRICKPYIFDVMISMVEKLECGQHQTGRVVALGNYGGGMFMPYFVSDLFYLGYTEDLIQLFSAPLNLSDKQLTRDQANKIVSRLTRRQNSAAMICPEIYIFKHYCTDVLECDGADTIESYWKVIKDYTICFSMKDVDLMWNKYNMQYRSNANSGTYMGKTDSNDRLGTMNFDFFNWLNLYMGNIVYDAKYEKYADVSLGANYEKSVK